MKRYEIIIKPLSAFGTPLKGDTLFGQFCWQLLYEFGKKRFENLIGNYTEKPFVVFSSAVPVLTIPEKRFILKRPNVPVNLVFSRKGMNRIDSIRKSKRLRSKKWMVVDENLTIDFSQTDLFFSDQELIETFMEKKYADELILSFERSHNTINRITGSTGKDMFAPFQEDAFCYYPGIELAIIVLVDEKQIEIDTVYESLRQIGSYGFGRDASTGMGRFSMISWTEMPDLKMSGADAIYSLAPSVPGDNFFAEKFFKLFVRFGKHGGACATFGNPFKKPVMMEDEGAMYVLNKEKYALEKPYIGRAVTNVSKSQPKTVVQGYTPYLPVKKLVRI